MSDYSIVQRAHKNFSKEIKDINTRLKSNCLGNGVIFFESCLNNNKLHLIKIGTQFFSQNNLRSPEGR